MLILPNGAKTEQTKPGFSQLSWPLRCLALELALAWIMRDSLPGKKLAGTACSIDGALCLCIIFVDVSTCYQICSDFELIKHLSVLEKQKEGVT